MELRSASIQVSGYPKVQAQMLVSDHGIVIGIASEPSALERFLGNTCDVPRRCIGCHRPITWTHGASQPLGVAGLCGQCTASSLTACFAKNGRHPRETEFWCRVCACIKDKGQRCSPDGDGRRRWLCLDCRRDQTRAADQRRRLRERSMASIG